MIRGPRASQFELYHVTLSVEMIVELFYPWQSIPQHAFYFNAFLTLFDMFKSLFQYPSKQNTN